MAKTQKKLYPKNLLKYNVFIEDKSMDSVYFNVSNIPQIFTGGRNSFLIDGSTLLKNGSSVLIEIIDANGNNIYNTPVRNYVEGTSLLISVEIYSTTPGGFATIIVMGEAVRTIDGSDIPTEWKNTYNVRWTKKVMVEPLLKSKSPLKFVNPPLISSVEEKRFYSLVSSSVDTVNLPITASLKPLFNEGRQKGYFIIAETPSTFSVNNLGGYITGSINVNGVSGSVGLQITDILNSSTAITNNVPIKLDNGQVLGNIVLYSGSYITEQNEIITSSVVLQYSQLNKSVDTKIPISFSKIKIFNLNTISGEVAKVKVYNKVPTDVSEYKLIADVPMVPSELIISESLTGTVDLGNFYISSDVSEHWYADELTIGSTTYPISGTAAYYDPEIAFVTQSNSFIVTLDGIVTGSTNRTFIKTGSRGIFTANLQGGATASNSTTFIKGTPVVPNVEAWDTQVYSSQGHSSSLFVSAKPTWTASLATQSVFFGLTTTPTLDASSSINYAWYLSGSGNLEIYKTGSYITSSGTFTTSSVLSIVYDNNIIKYLKDDVQQYAESRSVSGALYFDSTFFYTSSQGITDVKFGKLAEWDSQVYSTLGYTSSVFVSAKPTWQPGSVTQSVMFGLSTNPTASASTSSIDFAWYLSPSGDLEVYKSGSYVTSSGTYTPSSILTVKCEDDIIKYIKNNVVKHIENRQTSAELYFDSSFLYGTSQGITDVKFGLTPDQFTITPNDNVLISSIYADVPTDESTNQFSGSVANYGYFIGNRRPILVSSNTEYTLTFDAVYRNESDSISLIGNSPELNIYIIGVSGSQVISNNPLGQFVGRLVPTSQISRFEGSSFNFTPLIQNVGNIGIRFVVKNGFWNLGNISLKAASDGLFSPDEVDVLIPNTEYHNSLLQYKVEFFDINNNSANIAAISTPVFFTGSNIDLGILR